MSGFAYNFPRCTCAAPYLLNQACKIAEEARDVVCVARFYKARDDDAFDAREQARLVNDIAMETMDVIHAAETMLRMLDGLVDVDGLREEVVRKNREERFVDMCVDLYDSYVKGYVTLDDLREWLWEEANTKIEMT